MRILSLNINDFGGMIPRTTAGRNWFTSDDANPAKQKFLELAADGAIDAWTKTGHPGNMPTHRISRIDYAMMSPSMYTLLSDVAIDPALWDLKMTDHAALILDLKDISDTEGAAP